MIPRLIIALLFAFVLGSKPPAARAEVLTDSTTRFDTTSALAYYEYDSTRIVIRDNDRAEISRKARLRILRASGLDYAFVTLYDDAFSKLDNFEGRVISNEGLEIIKRSKEDMYKECGFGPSYTLYEDICTYSSNLSGGNFPFTVEFSCKRTLNSLFFWQDWQPEQAIPVVSSSYVIDAPLEFKYTFKLIPGDLAPFATHSTGAERSISTWAENLIPALDPPAFAPSVADLACRLEFSPPAAKLADYTLDGSSWPALARSHYGLFRDALKIGDEAAQVARQILGTASPSKNQLADLHDFLMSRQRYVAVSIGVGGWQPHNCNLTYNNRYGDCKDLSTLYAAMLTVAGVEAHVALARTKDLGAVDADFPSLANFNHVILMYLSGADTVWVDPTCSACAVNDLPNQVEGIRVLIVDPDKGTMIRTPVSKPEDNRVVRNVSLSLAADNSAQAIVDLEATGEPGHSFKRAAQDLTVEELGQYLQRKGIISSDLKIDRCVFDKHDSTYSRFACRITGSIRRAALKIDGRIHLKASFADSPIHDEFTDLDSRILPLVFDFPMLVADTIRVAIPEGWGLAALPPPQSSISDFGDLEIACDSTSGLMMTRTQRQTATIVEPASFDEFAKFLNTCKRALAITLVLQPR